VHLLTGDDKIIAEGEKLPDPIELGSEDAPPTVGAIYRGDSPEPEKEPTPPPPPPQPVVPEPKLLPLEPLSAIAPSLPQPMPYKNPVLTTPMGSQPFRPQQRYPIPSTKQQSTPTQPPAPAEQPLAFTMPVAVPSEVAELVARDNAGRVLWFGVPPLDIVGWGGSGGVRGHTAEYLARKRKREEQRKESMGEIEAAPIVEDKAYKKRASEVLVKALGLLGK
jgi:chromatin structure-remodeling complex subunit RSC1/2